jgi:PAS domain S-box-containing protein
LSIVRDISERKDAERALLEYAHVVQATKDFMAVLDEERRYAMVNESLLLSRGLRRDEVIGRFIWDVVGRDLYEASLRKPLDLCYQGQGQQIEVEFEFPAQGLRDLEIKLSPVLDSSGRVVRVAAVSSDISDRKKSEEALRRSEEKYRTILENMDEAYFELDLGGNLTFFNEALRKNLGYSREELLGMNNREYTRPESWKRMFDIFQNIYLTGEPARITDYEVEAKDGRVIVAEASAHLMRDEKGAPVGFRGLARDVTERKKSEQERQQLEAQLIQAQKMEAVGTLAGGIAHDFNNILQSLKGNIQLWLRKMDESDPGHKYLERMNTMTDRATELVRGLLTFSRTSSPQDLKPVDLNLLIAETVEILKRTVPKMITIHTCLNAEMSWIHGESTQLQQVLMNLVSNARDAMAPQESGNIWIESDNVSSGGQEGVKGLPSGDYIRIKVSDSGVGMDQQILEHIFEPFFSTKDVGQGTGLGLAMVYGIVQTHEGWIDCTSQEGVGTEFTILLPLTSTHSRSGQWHASGAGHPTALKGQLQQRPKSVLLVDDEAPVRDVTREWLEEKGFQVSTVKSGEEALDQVERNPQDFDVVLLDLNMPGMGGEAALKVLLRINPQLKIIVVSGYSGHTVSDDPPGTGAAAFLVKPFTLEELSASINQVLGD